MPPQAPKPPPLNVQNLAAIIGHCIDIFNAKVIQLSPAEILQAIEWVRYTYTESIISKGVHGKKPGEAA